MSLSCSCYEFEPEVGQTYFWHEGIKLKNAVGHKCCDCGNEIQVDEFDDPEEIVQCFTWCEMPEMENGSCRLGRSSRTCEIAYHHQWYGGFLEDGEQLALYDDCPSNCTNLFYYDESYGAPTGREDYRCVECTGLAESLEDAGYCRSNQGELFEDLEEYKEAHQLELEERKREALK